MKLPRSRPFSVLRVLLTMSVLHLVSSGHDISADEKQSDESLARRLPRIKATEPKDALKTFQLARGFRVELVASEPLVSDPVDACFDANGRMYVAEMHGYPFSQEPTRLNPKGGGKKDAGIIRLLEDTDGDGKMDRSVVFVDKISWPTSVCCFNGGIFVLAPTHIYYFKDTDGDDVADIREIVYSSFSRDNVQGLANNLKWRLDNRIYAAGGRNGAELSHRGKKLLTLGRRDIAFDPKTEKLETVSGGSQFGHSMDDWGNRFVCSNSNHMQQVIFPQRYLTRNPYLAVPSVIRTIAKEGGSSQVFRTSPPEPWRIIRQQWRAKKAGYKLVQQKDGSWRFVPLDPNKKMKGLPTEYPVGFFTSATGVTIYRGSAYPAEFRGNAFIGDVGGNLIHRKTVRPAHATFVAERADQNTEFLTSTDNWFRPVNYVNAPDGSLYVLDMYRETIEHPFSIPVEIKKYLDLESGADRGRIYRLVSPHMKRFQPPKLANASVAELVRQLESPNSWNRETAQRLLWERQDQSAAAPLKKLLRSSKSPTACLHALWTLEGLGSISADDLLVTLKDSHPGVREHAIRISERHLQSSPRLVDALLAMTGDANYRVRFQLAFSLGEIKDSRAVGALSRLVRSDDFDNDLRVAVLSSVADDAGSLAISLIEDPEFMKQGRSVGLINELGRIVGAHKDPHHAMRLLADGTNQERSPLAQQLVIRSVGEGLARRGSSIPNLIASDQANATLRKQMQRHFTAAAATANDLSRSTRDRISAIALLAYGDFKTAKNGLSSLLSPQSSQELQLAVVRALSNHTDKEVSDVFLSSWRSSSPAVRREIVDAMLRTGTLITRLLTALETKLIQRGEISRDKKQLLMNHPTLKIRDRARDLFAGEVNANRAKVIQAYQPVLMLEGDVTRGKTLFEKKCSVCHRVGKVGFRVGPDLASTKNKSIGDLLVAVLDPNREAQPNFTVYNVLSEQGRLFNGMISSETETSISLLRAEAKQDLVLRSNIDTLISTGKSLMPEGLEKDVTPQQLADILRFVKTIRPEKAAP